MGYYLAIKKKRKEKEIVPFATAWMNLESISIISLSKVK